MKSRLPDVLESGYAVRTSTMHHPMTRPGYSRRFGAFQRALVLATSGVVLWLVPAAQSADTLPLERMLAGPDAWRCAPEEFEKAFGQHGLRWLSADKDRARFFGSRLSLWNGAVRPVEIIVTFAERKPSAVEISIYNRADSREGFADERAFLAFVESQKAAVERGLGIRATPKPHDSSQMTPTQGWRFHNSSVDATLEYVMRPARRARNESFQAEFLRLRAVPSRSGAAFAPPPTVAARADAVPPPRQRVKRLVDGTVMIPDVPMVDQGPKGYCVVAATERVLRFYGKAVDQHELARLAGSDAAFGTDPDRMFDELRQKQGRLGVRLRELIRLDAADLTKLADTYTRMATQAGRPPLSAGGRLQVADILFTSADPALLMDLRVRRNPADFERFQRSIRQHVDRGEPLLWGVRLGLFPEPDLPQASGAHMRLIIGYDERKREIVFSDSWGAQHAEKRMATDQAWTITTRLAVIEP